MSFLENPDKVSFVIPLTKGLLVSEFNRSGEHWTKKSARHQQQHFLVNAYMNKYLPAEVKLPCHIKMIRTAPRELDYANLVGCLKWIQDALANSIIRGLAPGRADGDDRLTWDYMQEKGLPKQYALRIELSFPHHA